MTTSRATEVKLCGADYGLPSAALVVVASAASSVEFLEDVTAKEGFGRKAFTCVRQIRLLASP